MRSKNSFLRRAFLHPFLFALYPLLALWNTNITQIPAYAISRALLVILIFFIPTALLGLVLYRNWVKAAIFTSVVMLLALLYGHVYALVDAKTIGGFMIGRHRYILPLWIALMALPGILLWRYRGTPYSLNSILNIVGIFLVAMALGQIGLYELGSAERQAARPTPPPVEAASLNNQAAVSGPDVYYILMDGYARADELKARGGPDITGFEDQLTQMGFYVARCSLDNYDYTEPSLTSSLNMNYLDALNVPLLQGEPAFKSEDFEPLIKNSLIRQTFEAMGYKFVTFKTVYNWLTITDSDVYYNYDADQSALNSLDTINFQYLFLSTTILRPLLEAQTAAPQAFARTPVFLLDLIDPKANVFSTREYKQYQQNLFALQKLGEAPRLSGRKFVYAHLVITHQPYVFNPDGSFRANSEQGEQDYFAQIEYANKALIEVVQKILAGSKTPPVIIIQGDHGFVYTPERTRILNAYYLPGGGAKDLYPGITPVNSFRYVLNHYFDGNYPMLPDQTFHSPHDWHYRLEPVAPNCPAQ